MRAAQVGFLGQVDEQLQRLAGDAVLGVIQKQSRRRSGQAFAALRVGGEKLAQVQLADFFLVGGQGFPRGTLGEGFEI